MNKDKFVSISITKSVYEKMEGMMRDSGFKSLSTYIEFLLEDKIAQYTAEKDGVELSKNDEERIKQRLRELGYLK